jgi:D-alanyl-D-alanine carboxypeptidase
LRLLPILLLAACAQQQAAYGPRGRAEIGADGWKFAAPSRYYPPPGPPEDPWGPYIREASARYGVPGHWVRAVMHQESGGEQQATSPVGAMGLMQVMPNTYEELRARYQLGDDPYEPRNNILAGTAYIREMYDRFGTPGFLAAYNAGPDRVDDYLARRAPLPDDTVNYVAAITPNLGTDVPRSGPFAVFASARSGRAQRPTVASLAAGCDVNAAYNPDHPCTYLMQAAAQPAPLQTASVQQFGDHGCDLNAAYDPDHPCTSVGRTEAEVAPTSAPTPQPPRPARSNIQLASAEGCDRNQAFSPARPCGPAIGPSGIRRPAAVHPTAAATPAALHHHETGPHPSRSAEPGGGWAIQVGAFKTQGLARAMAESARAQAPDQLRHAGLALQPTAPFGNTVLYRARLVHLSGSEAASACTRLNHRQLPCVVVRPNSV